MKFLVPTADRLRELLGAGTGLRVSIYVEVPENPGFDAVQAFPRTCASVLDDAEGRMRELGVDTRKVSGLRELWDPSKTDLRSLDPATRGIAVFLGPAGVRRFGLVRRVETAAYVGGTFRIRPLIAAMSDECRFRVVGLTSGEVALYEGDARGLRALRAKDVPRSLVEALGAELTEGQLQFHGVSQGGTPYFHGNGGAGRERNVDRERFHRVLARSLGEKMWNGRRDPVVLVAGSTHQGRFRKLADLPGLLDEGIEANFTAWSNGEVHARALELVRKRYREREREQLEEASAALAQGLATSELGTAAVAAVSGRVARVAVSARGRVERHLDAATGTVDASLGDEDALDELSGIVAGRGGGVQVFERTEGQRMLPDLIAVLRL